MAQGGPTGHVGSDGSLPEYRVRKQGYDFLTVGENVAAGQPEAREVMERWMGSEHHRENILSGGFRDIGIAYAGVRWSRYGTYWVQVFGTLADSTDLPHRVPCNPSW
jgi:uncharacterized protein YkwD